MKEQEAVWIRQAAAGDPAAFEQLVLTYQKPVYNLALRMVGNPDDAFDLTQEAFLRAWRSMEQVRESGAFSSWLFRLTSNVCLDFLRAAKRRKTVSLSFEGEDGEQQLELPDPSPDPEHCLLAMANRQAVMEAMNDLAVEHRQILTLRVINELSYQQIAEILDVAEGTVKSRLSRARRALRKKLEQSGNESASASSKLKEGRKRHGLRKSVAADGTGSK